MPYEKVGNNESVCIADEVPFEIPESWEWVRLSSLVSKEIKRGKSPKYSTQKGIQVFAQKCNTKSGKIDMTLAKYLDSNVLTKYPQEEYLQNQDIIINSTGNGTLGRIGFFQDAARIDSSAIVPDSHVTVIRLLPSINKAYLLYVLRYYQPYLEKQGEGSTNQTELKPIIISNLFIPIPPKVEQTRIADKLNDVFPFVDKYGSREEMLVSYNREFADKLRKSILQLAVQGKLVSQNPDDEPASVLLERIHAENEQLIKEGKIKRDKHESVIYRRGNSHYEKLDGVERCIDDEIPFEIPQSWQWCRLKEIMNVVSARRVHQSDWFDEGIPFYRAREIAKLAEFGRVNNELFISQELYDEYSKTGVPKGGDLMVTAVGTLGKTYVVKDTDIFYYKDASVICFENFSKVNSYYIQLVMQSPYMEAIIKDNSSGTTVGTITIIKANEYWIPLPPISEQERIVSETKRLMTICKKL